MPLLKPIGDKSLSVNLTIVGIWHTLGDAASLLVSIHTGRMTGGSIVVYTFF